MTKRSSVRLLSFGLLLAGILIIYAITGTVQAAQYRARLESTYRQSLPWQRTWRALRPI